MNWWLKALIVTVTICLWATIAGAIIVGVQASREPRVLTPESGFTDSDGYKCRYGEVDYFDLCPDNPIAFSAE